MANGRAPDLFHVVLRRIATGGTISFFVQATSGRTARRAIDHKAYPATQYRVVLVHRCRP